MRCNRGSTDRFLCCVCLVLLGLGVLGWAGPAAAALPKTRKARSQTFPADRDSTLQWQVDPQSGVLRVRRTGANREWLAERLGEIAYWDQTAAQHASPLTAAAGWTFDRQPAAVGCQMTCRHAALGFSLRVDFAVDGDVLSVSVPASGIAESGPARLKSLRLLPRFGAAREGDNGYLVTTKGPGALCYFRDKKPAEQWMTVYQYGTCAMPLFGLVSGRSAVAGILTSGQCDARLCVSTNWGPQHQYAIDPAFNVRTFAKEPRVPDDLMVDYHFLPAEQATWLGVAQRYRQYNFTRRGLRPLRQRVAESAGLAYSAQSIEVRLRLAVKPVPYPVTEQTPDNEPPVRVFLTFARVRALLDEFHRQGIRRAEFCLVGWNRGGHDGRYPQIFPVEPALGGEAELRATIRHAQALGYQIVAHDCYYGAYRISDEWDEAYLRKQENGQPRKGGIWGGGQSYNICLTRAYELFARRDLPRIRALGFQGVHYSDVLSILGPRPCYDSRHPETRRQDAEAATRILALAGQLFGGAQSEGPLDFTAPALDRLLYVYGKQADVLRVPYVDACVPLYPAVYHGVLLYNLSHETLNSLPGETDYLRSIEYGAAPLVGFYGHFLLDPAKNWMGTRDYRYDSVEGLRQAVTGIRRVYDDTERLKHLQLELLADHRQLADEVMETTYANGQRVVVNYRQQAYRLPNGQSVPPRNYLLLAR